VLCGNEVRKFAVTPTFERKLNQFYTHDHAANHDLPATQSSSRCKIEEFCTTDRVFARRARLVHCPNAHCGNNFGRRNQSGREGRPPKTQKSPSPGTISHRRHHAAVQNATEKIEPGAAYRQTPPTRIINLRPPITDQQFPAFVIRH
jgi:hypothetical protein